MADTLFDTPQPNPLTSAFDSEVEIRFPLRFSMNGKVHGNQLVALAFIDHTRKVRLSPYTRRGVGGYLATDAQDETTFISARPTTVSTPAKGILHIPDADTPEKIADPNLQKHSRWLQPRPIAPIDELIADSEERCKAIVDSWKDRFEFHQERVGLDGVREPGLRRPQIGALYAALAHWSVSDAAATIVMPTGTGKTETMLALLVCAQIPRLMVVVPNNALRDQITRKFLTLGRLTEARCLGVGAALPVVAKLTHRPNSPDEVDQIFRRANVVVSTMQIAGQCTPEVQERMARLCSHLFIDEAHHIAAKTWTEFKRKFAAKPILQFTATPFRTDGKRVDGKFIYTYPLARAQSEGYFKPITFIPIAEFNQRDGDRVIARKARDQLEADLAGGLDHVLMARVDTTERADAVLQIYKDELPSHNPIAIHSKVPAPQRRQLLEELHQRKSRAVVCVDMFGEGFDFPELKIAALHDRHKSLAITLQFIGRFTRDLRSVGDASVIANIADGTISDALRNLYAEDADWNFLLKVLSEAATDRARKRAEVLEGFTEPLADVPLQTLFPKMTAVVYRTLCDQWNPLKVEDVVPGASLYAGPVINPQHNLAIFITRDEEFVRWGSVKQIQNVEWNLYVLHWNEDLGLLFINSSNKDFHQEIAEAVAGCKDPIRGENIYRALGHVNRLTLTNLGLSHALGKNIRYTMFMGADIADGLAESQKINRRKSNLFGLGYEDDERVTIGCSSKGRLWSHRVAYDLAEWTEWCAHIGRKLLDEQISVDSILENVIKARRLKERPPLVPVMVAWPEDFLAQPEERIDIEIGSATAPFYECEIDVESYSDVGPLTFAVSAAGQAATFIMDISEDQAQFRQVAGAPAIVAIKGKKRPLVEYFNIDPPIIHFANGDFLVFNELFELPRAGNRAAFDMGNITIWAWEGVDLRKESQGASKDPTSIQRRVIERVIGGEFGEFEIVFDDDGSGEAADVVGIHRQGKTLKIIFFHCKFSMKGEVGKRIDDLYAVCGQAQKCVHWREDPRRLLKHLLHREDRRRENRGTSRFEVGDAQTLQQILGASREMIFDYEVVIVQPGLSKSRVAAAQLDVLGATETFLKETYSIPLRVIASS